METEECQNPFVTGCCASNSRWHRQDDVQVQMLQHDVYPTTNFIGKRIHPFPDVTGRYIVKPQIQPTTQLN